MFFQSQFFAFVAVKEVSSRSRVNLSKILNADQSPRNRRLIRIEGFENVDKVTYCAERVNKSYRVMIVLKDPTRARKLLKSNISSKL